MSLPCRVSILTAVFLTLSGTASAQQASTQQECVVAGDSLSSAREIYTAQCNVKRVDCDPFNGQWYCASFWMNSSTPPALTIFQSEPVVSEPVVTTPVVVDPTEIEPIVEEPVVEETIAGICEDSTPIGDGWGWDGTQSCQLPVVATPIVSDTVEVEEPVVAEPVVEEPAAEVTQPVIAEPVAGICEDAAPIGDGWGWDGIQSCVLPVAEETAALEPTTTKTIDAEPATPTEQTIASKSAADITDLILVTGQSNALGAGTAYDESLDSPSNNVYAFTNDGWQVASLKQVWDLNWHPLNHPDTDPSNNFALHFGKSATARDSSRVIGFILATNPGSKISSWEYQSEFYNSMQTKVLDAINQLPHKSELDGILWHQGESDGEDKQYYTDALYTLIYTLRDEAWVDATAPFICGETKITAVNNRLNGLNQDTDPTTACVPAEDLSDLGDDRHFDAPALRTLGARYADEYLRITE